MINETIKRIHIPNSDKWFVIETDRRFYELRMGGYVTAPPVHPTYYPKSLEFPDRVVIKSANTDGENLYIALSNGEYLIHGFHNISADGETSAMVRRLTKEEFLDHYGELFFNDPDIHQLRTDAKGNSEGRE